ncbi:MAG: dipeptidase [Chloroflexi bacterium]|nr:dipeptidase [Chloroflexota bacterium]
MTDQRSAAIQLAASQRNQTLADLKELVKIPSISTSQENKKDMLTAANWIAAYLTKMGMKNVQVLPTAGNPSVYGEAILDSSYPTVLIYGHYDVQPPDPLELWHSDPFNPTQDGDLLFGRGTSDMKGQILACFAAVDATLKTGGLKVNIKFILEGEEEIGSPNLAAAIRAHKDLLACDFVLNPDTGMVGENIPAITYGLRGLSYFEIKVTGPDHDLHSGLFGGIVHNPAQALAEVIAAMHDENGRVTLPGFYDDVRVLDEKEREELSRLPVSDADYLRQTGAPALWGEKGFTPAERLGARPTLEVHGLYSGFIGEGQKTVLPSYAIAKISSRLVPNQDHEKVYQQLLTFLQEKMPPTVKWEAKKLSGGAPLLINPDQPATIAFARALETAFQVKPVFKLEGGSVPVTTDLQEILGVQSILTGFGLPEDNIHSPNERLHLPTFYKGIDTLVHFLYNIG